MKTVKLNIDVKSIYEEKYIKDYAVIISALKAIQ